MLRAGLAADQRAQMAKAPLFRQAQAVATAEVQAASSAAVVTETIDTRVLGDLVERSPALTARLRQFDERLAALE